MSSEKVETMLTLKNPNLLPIKHDSPESMRSPKLQSVEPRWQVQGLPSQKSARVALAWLLTLIFIFSPLYKIHQQATRKIIEGSIFRAQNLTADELPPTDFGGMARRVSAIIEVGEFVKRYPKLDHKPLSHLIQSTFPWWVQTQDIYTPWQKSSAQPFDSDTSLIIPVGKYRAHFAADLIVTLRLVLGSKIPVEVAYAGHTDLPLVTREKLRLLGEPNISFIDVTETFDDTYISFAQGTWAIKPFAMLASKYPKNILVDSDTIIFSSPDNIFNEDPELRRTGIRLFHDRILEPHPERTSWIKNILTAAGRSNLPTPALNNSLIWNGITGEMVDSGMVLWDKSRPSTFLALMYVAWMNTREPRVSETYERWYGDKETFFLGPEFLGVEYSMAPEYAGHIGNLEPGWDGPADGPQMMSLCSEHVFHVLRTSTSRSGRPEFKPFWLNGGLYYSKNHLNFGYANFSHWWPGSADHEAQGWQFRDSPQMTGWMCARTLRSEVRKIGPDDEFRALWEKMVNVSSALEGVF